jgi:peptide deformylase
MIRRVLLYPDPVLKCKSRAVAWDEFDKEELRTLVADLRDTCIAYHGVGLAAVQVGVLQRVVLVGRSMLAMVNPVIVGRSEDTAVHLEGCLSFPDVFEVVRRRLEVDVEYQRVDGERVLESFKGLDAHAVQHELEHLDGQLLSDHMNRQRRWVVKKLVAKNPGITPTLFGTPKGVVI